MKRLVAASAFVLGTAGMAMAEPIILEESTLPSTEEGGAPLYETYSIDTTTQDLCTTIRTSSTRGGIFRTCENFYEEDPITQSNVLTLLSKTGTDWRPKPPQHLSEQAFESLKDFGWKGIINPMPNDGG